MTIIIGIWAVFSCVAAATVLLWLAIIMQSKSAIHESAASGMALFVVVAAYLLAKSTESIYLAATKGKPRG